MNEWMSKLILQLLQSNRCGVDLETGRHRPENIPSGECLSAKPCCIMHDCGRCWLGRKSKHSQHVFFFFKHKANRLLVHPGRLSQPKLWRERVRWKKNWKKKKKKSDQQELGSGELCPTFWVRRDHRPVRNLPIPPPAPIEDRFKASLYIELQLIASLVCCQSELSHQTLSCVIFKQNKVKLEWKLNETY